MPTFNQSTASAASGDIIVSLTPSAANNLELVVTSAWQTSTTPSGWTQPVGALYWRTSPDTNPLTFDTSTPQPVSQWTALMLDLPTLTTPTLEQAVFIDFGTFPSFHPYTHTFSGMNQLNAGDCIVWVLGMNSVSAPTGLNVSDSQGNTYQIFQFTQNVGGVFVTSLMAIAFGASAGTCTTNFDITVPSVGGQGFALNLCTFSGVQVPPPDIPPLQPVFLAFQDPAGNPLAFGSVKLQLQQDVSKVFPGGPQIAAGRTVTLQLDQNGAVLVNLWETAAMTPLVPFFATAYTAQGQPAWNGYIQPVQSGQPSFILLEDGSPILLESGAPNGILTEVQ